ncbi:hypothetical protein IIB79_09545 [candidate division KSB1 bacterium]|nr:hypothetical protein [candidate division KSB1 bacterium]
MIGETVLHYKILSKLDWVVALKFLPDDRFICNDLPMCNTFINRKAAIATPKEGTGRLGSGFCPLTQKKI